MNLKDPKGYTNNLETELDQFLNLYTIVENLPGNSFVLAQQGSEYPDECNGLLEEKSILRDPLVKCAENIDFDPYTPIVLSVATFHVKGNNPHNDLVISCFTPNDWKISMTLSKCTGEGTFSFSFNSTTEDCALVRTSDLEDLFLSSMDILTSQAKRPHVKLSVA